MLYNLISIVSQRLLHFLGVICVFRIFQNLLIESSGVVGPKMVNMTLIQEFLSQII